MDNVIEGWRDGAGVDGQVEWLRIGKAKTSGFEKSLVVEVRAKETAGGAGETRFGLARFAKTRG